MRLRLKLQRQQMLKHAFIPAQFIKSAAFCNISILNNEDFVCAANRRQPVRNDDGRAVFHHCTQAGDDSQRRQDLRY